MKRTIDVAAPVNAGTVDVAEIVATGAGLLFDDDAVIDRPNGVAGEFQSDLHFGGQNGSVHHKVVVHLAASPVGRSRTWLMTVRPQGHARLLPSFEGTIALDEQGGRSVVRVHGAYEPPLGVPGAFGDGLVGFRIARRSLDSFVHDVARRIDRAVDQRAVSARAPVPVPDLDARDVQPVSENWLG
jgi:hypothetical protein